MIPVKYLRSADLNVPLSIKTIAIIGEPNNEYSADVVGIFTKHLGLSDVTSRYILVDRDKLDLILKEQKLSHTDEFDANTSINLGNLLGAQGLIFTGVKNIKESDTDGIVKVSREHVTKITVDEDGKTHKETEWREENISSKLRITNFFVNIKFVDSERGNIIFQDVQSITFKQEKVIDTSKLNTKYYKNENRVDNNESGIVVYKLIVNQEFKTLEQIISNYAENIASSFVKKIAPYAVEEWSRFEIISGDKINLKFLNFIKANLYREALEFMIDDIDVINSIEKPYIKGKHYYNIAKTYEIMNDLDKSYEYHKLAVGEEASRIHLRGLKNIQNRIDDSKKLNKQLIY